MFNIFSAIASIIWMVIGLGWVILTVIKKVPEWMQHFVEKYILWIGLAITGASLVGSLIYSNVIGYPACLFCWFARIFLYGGFVLYLTALIRKDRSILPYTFIFSIIGIFISGYHYLAIDLAHVEAIACGAGSVSCATRYVYEFGFVTIPFMALSAFVILLGAHLIAQKKLTV